MLLGFGGVSVPAQDINVTGTLTPTLSASGRWGNLGVTYDGRSGLVRVAGAQTLTAFGQTGLRVVFPGPGLNTDNGAMIALSGAAAITAGRAPSPLSVGAEAYAPLATVPGT